MRAVFAALTALFLSACSPAAPAAQSGPSAAILDMRDRFETAVLAMEGKYAGDPTGLRNAAMPIALSIYGANWDVVRAEAQRSLASLSETDLASYAAATPTPNALAEDLAGAMKELVPLTTPGGLAMMRFWDAEFVGGMIGPMTVRFDVGNESAEMIGTKLSLVPMRISRGTFEDRDVLAIRYMRSMVIAPYTITPEGMIMPAFDLVRVYPLQPAF